jgi:hypothetical protein
LYTLYMVSLQYTYLKGGGGARKYRVFLQVQCISLWLFAKFFNLT